LRVALSPAERIPEGLSLHHNDQGEIMKIRKYAAVAATVAAAASGAGVFAATAASAATAGSAVVQPTAVRSYTAISHLTNRPDSGGNGNWANDDMHRTLTIRLLGSTGTGSSTVYYYSASVKDVGTFKTIDGAYTPNQGAPFTGQVENGSVPGTLRGSASYSFTANALPNVALVPAHVDGSADSTSTWYELAFPKGTTFGGAGIGNWGWRYNGPVVVTLDSTGKHVLSVSHERWADTASNDAGQLAADGNIDGFGH
jgi:hypothetical protein